MPRTGSGHDADLGDVSKLLLARTGGEQSALDKLTPVVYQELHRLARCYMKGERPSHSLPRS